MEVLPLHLRPRILPLEKWDEELVSGLLEDFADRYDVGFHAKREGGLRSLAAQLFRHWKARHRDRS
jgi:hypothetical protein